MFYWISKKKPIVNVKPFLEPSVYTEFLILCWEADDSRNGHKWNRNSSNFCNFLRYEMVSDSRVKKKKNVRSNFRGKEIRYSLHIEYYDACAITLQRTSISCSFAKLWTSIVNQQGLVIITESHLVTLLSLTLFLNSLALLK